jgi:hypothetical protein
VPRDLGRAGGRRSADAVTVPNNYPSKRRGERVGVEVASKPAAPPAAALPASIGKPGRPLPR